MFFTGKMSNLLEKVYLMLISEPFVYSYTLAPTSVHAFVLFTGNLLTCLMFLFSLLHSFTHELFLDGKISFFLIRFWLKEFSFLGMTRQGEITKAGEDAASQDETRKDGIKFARKVNDLTANFSTFLPVNKTSINVRIHLSPLFELKYSAATSWAS